MRLILSVLIVVLIAMPSNTPAAGGNRIVEATRFESINDVQGIPPGREMERYFGTPRLVVKRSRKSFCLHLLSDEESFFGIKRKMEVRLPDHPFLNGCWKVGKLPLRGDVRRADRDDQAAQIYAAFSPAGFPARWTAPVAGCIWDNESPAGWTGRSPQTGLGNVRYVVVRNKADRLNRRYCEKRNLHADFNKLFKGVGDAAMNRTVKGIAVFINAHHTRSCAGSEICDIFFSRDSKTVHGGSVD